jgi:hypothetical protein
VSPPWTAKASHGLPSFTASDGVSVTRGRLPGASTLYGFSEASSTKLCMRCDRPMPVSPAMKAGTQPPLGVAETTQPSASAARIEVVPARKAASRSAAAAAEASPCTASSPGVPHFSSRSRNGFVPPWNG